MQSTLLSLEQHPTLLNQLLPNIYSEHRGEFTLPNIVLLGSMIWNINTKGPANINPDFVNWKIFNGHFQTAAVIVGLDVQ